MTASNPVSRTEAGAPKRIGRPRGFDRDEALETAMTLFWQHGYEGVSIGDLTKAIGIAPPSLYGAFGSKAELYEEALDRYEAKVGAIDYEAIRSADSLQDAARLFLVADACFLARYGRGCMVSVGMVASHPSNDGLAAVLTRRRERMTERIAEAFSKFGSAEDMKRLARYLVTVMQGLSVQAKDGASEADLREIVEDVLAGLQTRYG